MAWISRYGLPSVPNIRAFFIFMNEIQVFEYKGNKVTFDFGNGVMTNATEMARAFGKEPYGWIRLATTKEFLWQLLIEKYPKSVPQILRNETGNLRNETELGAILTEVGLVKIIQGGNSSLQGTWFNDDITIEFARWLSPAFAIWCNDRIKEILTGTMAKYPMSSDEAIAYGYGKALEKMNRQSAIIARQSKLLRKYKSQIAVDKEKKRERTMFMSDRSKDNVSRWISENGISGLLKLSALHKGYHEWCEKKCVEYMPPRMLCRCLRSLEYVSKHKRDGTWFMI